MINVINRVVDTIDVINVMNDKDVIKLEFKLKNQVTDLLKLTDCNAVYINYQNGSTKDRYLITDLTASGDDVTFSWTLGANATKSQGKTYFVICAQRTDGSGNILQEWNSVLAFFDVKRGLETVTQPTEELQDIFTQLIEMIDGKLSPSNVKGGTNVTVEVDGEAVIINSQGGVDYYKVVYSLGTTPTANKSFNEIASAYAEGKTVVGMVTTRRDVILPLCVISNSNLIVATIREDNVFIIQHSSSNEITSASYKLSDFVTLSDFTTALNLKQDKLTAGAGISIINNVITATLGVTFTIVNSLPAEGSSQTIYLMLNGSQTAQNIYDEYIWLAGSETYEKIGTTQVDLTDYYNKTEVDNLLSAKLGTADVVQSTGQNTNKVMSQKAVTDSLATKMSEAMYFENLSVSSWDSNSDSGYSAYSYKKVLTTTGVTDDTYVTAILDVDNPEDYACVSGTNSVTIYAKSNTALDIPLIIAGSPVITGGGSGEVIYSSTEQKIGKWIDNADLFEKTIATTISSGRASAMALSTLLGCTPDYVNLAETNCIDNLGQKTHPYSTDAKLIASSGMDYGSYCSGLVSYPHITLPEFASIEQQTLPSYFLENQQRTYIIYNSYDEFYYLFFHRPYSSGTTANFITNNSLLTFSSSNGDGVAKVYKWKQGYSESWEEISNNGIAISNVNKFVYVYTKWNEALQGGVPYLQDGQDTFTLGNGGNIDVQYFDPATGVYLNNDQSALGNRTYAGQDYLFVYVNEDSELCIANGSNYPVLPMTVYTTIQYTKSNGGA